MVSQQCQRLSTGLKPGVNETTFEAKPLNFNEGLCTKSVFGRGHFSRKGAKAQSAAAFLRFSWRLCAFAPLREKNFLAFTRPEQFEYFSGKVG
jgi:hypothetical protein